MKHGNELALEAYQNELNANILDFSANLTGVTATSYRAYQYDQEAKSYDLNVQSAKNSGDMISLKLQETYNKTQEQQLLQMMMQGRTGASIDNILRVQDENLNWDLAYNELQTQGKLNKVEQAKIQAQGNKNQAIIGAVSGLGSSALGLMSSYNTANTKYKGTK